MFNKKNLILAAGLIALGACTQMEIENVEVEPALNLQKEFISIPIVAEDLSTDTKSYYYETPTYWSYQWEDNDVFKYFYYNRSTLLGSRTANVNKDETSTVIEYTANDLEVGNNIYSFYVQKSLKGEATTNNDPSAIKMVIPTDQSTDKVPETFTTVVDPSFDLGDFQLDKLQEDGSGSFIGQKGVPDRTVTFSIIGYNPEYTYEFELVSGKAIKNCTCDENGNCSVTAEFNSYDWGSGTESKTKFKVINTTVIGGESCEENNVSVEIKATRSGATSTLSHYECRKGAVSTCPIEVTSRGAEMPYPIREAMPCASRVKTVTTSLLKYPEDIANSMTIYLLGSCIEFKIYSGTTGAHVGEDIIGVNVETNNAPCAGICYYNLLTEDLTLFGFDENEAANYSIDSNVELCGYKVPAAKGGEESVYMVIRPGTYNGVISVITKDSNNDKWVYKFGLNNKTFERAIKQPFGVNLDKATRIAYVEPGDGPTEEAGEGEEDEL